MFSGIYDVLMVHYVDPPSYQSKKQAFLRFFQIFLRMFGTFQIIEKLPDWFLGIDGSIIFPEQEFSSFLCCF